MPNDIPQKISGAFSQGTLQNRETIIRPPYNSQTMAAVNQRTKSKPQGPTNDSSAVKPQPAYQSPPVPQPVPPVYSSAPKPQPVSQAAAVPAIPKMAIPLLPNLLKKGQKAPLDTQNAGICRVTFGFGWNVTDNRCDIDASAFLVTETGKVPGDDWFVFYGQDRSPDGSVVFAQDSTHTDREMITADLSRLDQRIKKIIFVLTINEAFQNHLNFSMIRDPYVRIMDSQTRRVLLSYKMEDLYANVTSMTIGELYLHNGAWKFNPVGNGVQQDLAGQCAIYGVAIE